MIDAWLHVFSTQSDNITSLTPQEAKRRNGPYRGSVEVYDSKLYQSCYSYLLHARPSVCLSVFHALVLEQNDATSVEC